jgi:F-type H+-transporting ATPase subunit b
VNLFNLYQFAQAWAASSGEEAHGPSINQIWFPLVNFLIFAFIIKIYVLPLVRNYLLSRRGEVLDAVKTAAAHKQRAEAFVQDYEARLARLTEESNSILEALRAESEREKTKLLSEADALAAKIRNDARFLADQEIKIAKQQIRQHMAETAKAKAVELVRRHISAADQSRLVEDFIQNIGQTP